MSKVRRTVAEGFAGLRELTGRRPLPPPPKPALPPVAHVKVETPEGVPDTIADAQQKFIEARMLGTRNLFVLAERRNALEALIAELRK
jgi:hypothetical protein